MNAWLPGIAALLASAVTGASAAVGVVYLAGDSLFEVDDRIERGVQKEMELVSEAAAAERAAQSQQAAQGLSDLLSGVGARLDALERRSYRLSNFMCSGLEGETVVTDVQLMPSGFDQQQVHVTTKTICVEEE